MSNSKGPWDIIGWGIIGYVIICALPFILVWVITLWFIGYFAILWKLLLAGFAVFLWIVLSAVEQKQKEDKLWAEHKAKQREQDKHR